MRNLKRALSLTLASVMLLGMMVLGTSAASYPDVTDEHNVEAIEVLQAIGVMSGSNSGNFNPDSKVTRIEMAIVMANLLDLDVDYFQGQNQFSDVPEWASGYVNACAASGIVTGVGGGRFGTGNVTATQAALMMLKALGYFQYNSDFNGDWAQATALQASRIGLFKDIKAQDNTQLDRNQVAQLALNTLESTMVDAEDNTLNITTGEDAGNLNITGGQVKYIVRTSDDNKIGKSIRTGIANGGTSSSQLNGQTLELGEQLYQGDLVKRDSSNNITDDFGRPATKWTYKGREIGVYSVAADLTYTKDVKLSDIYKDLNLGSPMDKDHVDFYIDGKGETDTTGGDILTNNSNGTTALKDQPLTRSNDEKVGGKGTLTQVFYDKDDEKATVTVIYSYLVKVTGNYDSSDKELNVVAEKCTLPAPTAPISLTLSSDDFEGLENYKDGDRLVITVEHDGASGSVRTVRPAEKVTAVAKSYIVNDSVTMDTQKYEYSAKYNDKGTVTYTIDNSYDLYLDAYGYVLLRNPVEAEASEYVFIMKTVDDNGLNVGGDRTAAAYFTDGTYKAITVSKYNGNTITSDFSNQWCTYTIRNDKYELTPVAQVGKSGIAAETDITQNGKVSINYETSTSKGTSATIFITRKTDNTVKAYTGIKEVPTITSKTGTLANAYVVNNENGFAKYVFIDLGSAELSKTNTSSDLIYVLKTSSKAGRDEDNNSFYQYDAIVNGVKGKAKAQNLSIFGAVGLYTDVEYDDDGYVKAAVLLTYSNTVPGGAKYEDDFMAKNAYSGAAVTDYENVLTVGSDNYALASDAKIFRIKDNGDTVNTGVTTSTLSADYSSAKGGLTGRVYGVLKDGMYTELYVDTNPNAGVVQSVQIPENPSADDITNAFAAAGANRPVEVPSGVNITVPFTVPAGATLNIKTGATVSGKVTAEAGSTVTSNVNLTGGVEVKSGATVVLDDGVTAMPALTGNGTVAVTGDVDLTSGWDSAESAAFDSLLSNNAASGTAADATPVPVDTSNVVAFKGAGKIPGFGTSGVDGYVGAGNTGKLVKLTLDGVAATNKVSAKVTKGGVESDMKFGAANQTQYTLQAGDITNTDEAEFAVLVSSNTTKIDYTVVDNSDNPVGTFTFTFGS